MFSLFHLLDETLGRLESWHVMSVNNDGCVLGNVTCRLLCTVLNDETAETAQIDILSVNQR